MRKFALSVFLLGGLRTVQSLPSSTAAQNCTGTFTPVSASAAFAGLNPGWNLGNTLDAIPDEGSWNNPPVQATTFSEVHAKGFKSVRIPGKCTGVKNSHPLTSSQ
jgi:endoglucanase